MATEAIGTVLTVEDEPEIRKLTTTFLESIGFRVLEAQDGQAASELLKQETPDIIVSDMKMPRKDGMSLLKELRDAGNQTPFLFLSAFTTKEYTVRALSLGAFDYLEKPFLPNDLKALMLEMLRVSKAQRGAFQKAGINTQSTKGGSSPEIAILRMSSLSGSESTDVIEQAGTPGSERQAKLIRLFVSEAQGQLTHGLKVLTDLKHTDSPGWQLGYLFRIMHSIRSTAATLQLTEIAELSSAMEQTYVLLRVRTSYLNKITLANLQVAHEILHRHFDLLGSAEGATYEEKQTLSDDTKHVIQDLKSVVVSR